MQATSGRNRVGQSAEQQLFGWVTGLRPQPYVPPLNHLYEDLYDERDETQQQLDDLIELRVHKTKDGADTPEYERLKDRKKRLDIRIYRLETKLGKKDATEPPGLPKTEYEEWKDSASLRDEYRDWKDSGNLADEYDEWKRGQ
jgi:hypothetical protein